MSKCKTSGPHQWAKRAHQERMKAVFRKAKIARKRVYEKPEDTDCETGNDLDYDDPDDAFTISMANPRS